MKQITSKVSVLLAFIYVLAMSLSSCSSSESVVSNNFLQKRKYNKGFHKSKKKNVKVNNTVSEEVLVLNKEEKSTIKTESSFSKEEKVEEAELATTNEEIELVATVSESEVSTEKTTSTKTKLVEALEAKVEKVASILKNKTVINTPSNTSSTSDDMMILLIILAILIPFVAVGIYTDWDVTKTVIALLLTLLFWIPGVIYALITINS